MKVKILIPLMLFTLFSVAVVRAADATAAVNDSDKRADSIEVSLLTCGPGSEVYSLYGHTAIRITDRTNGADIVVNYGLFSFKKPFFILRFIFGLTDYEMGIEPFDAFQAEYSHDGRYVVQQVLNLTRREKEDILRAIGVNYQPENRIYRYNYFYDNCTTRARDILTGNIKGQVVYAGQTEGCPPFRQLIHNYNENNPWARYGNDILLGVRADLNTTQSEHQFLPLILKSDFSRAVIKATDGSERPLVSRQFCVIGNDHSQKNSKNDAVGLAYIMRPLTCSWLLFALVTLVILAEYVTKRNFWLFDSLLMLVVGLAGIILFMMIFSQHPATSINLQLLLLNPIPLLYIWRVAKKARRGEADRFWRYAAVAIIIMLAGGFFQQYAEGMSIVALSLLIRCLWTITFKYKKREGE